MNGIGTGIKILIADGSLIYKKVFAQAVAEAAPDAEVIYAAGREDALGIIRLGGHDVIILDSEIVMTGIADVFLEIRQASPKAVVLVAARPSSTNYSIFAVAEANGAACMLKPIYDSYAGNLNEAKNRIADLIKVARARREGKWIQPEMESARAKVAANRDFRPEIVLMAASTGGPSALAKVLSGLNGSFPVPVLIVQHTLPQFTGTLAQDLDKKSNLTVKVAENGEPIAPGTVYLAPGGLHMRLDAGKRIAFDDSPPVNGVCPAADKLFESAAEVPWTGVLAVILTGMGRDGKKGLARLKEKQDCVCFAQSEKTCVVYGMPRAAVESGLADKVLDLDDIAQGLQAACP